MFLSSHADEMAMTTDDTQVASVLKRAVLEFDTNRVGVLVIRKLASDAPELFAALSTELLMTASDTPGYRFLAIQLVKQPSAVDRLTDHWRFTASQAIQLARKLLKVDPTLDVRLARRLPGRNGSAVSDTLKGAAAERALDILDEISEGRRVVPLLNHLIDHPDKKISSKAALLIGRRVQNIAWAARVIAEGEDPRTRANAIESIWGGSSAGAVDLFHASLNDSDNRVVGNAIVGLHLAGDPEVSNVVIKFAEDFKPEFRMTAAWAMGRVGDPIFVPLLTPLIKDSHPGVRRAALKALHGIRQIERKLNKEEIAEGDLASIDANLSTTTESETDAAAAAETKPLFDFAVELRLDGSKYASDKNNQSARR